MYHPIYYYAGTPDDVGFDFKSGPWYPHYDIQLGAYDELCRANGIAPKIWHSVHLRKDGNYRMEQKAANRDHGRIFINAITNHYWKANNLKGRL
jgi:hypothetical protein